MSCGCVFAYSEMMEFVRISAAWASATCSFYYVRQVRRPGIVGQQGLNPRLLHHSRFKLMQTTKFIHINSRDEYYRIDVARIVYFEADGNYTNFTLSNGQKDILSMNLAQTQMLILENLKADATQFIRVGKRHIVNREYIYHIEVLHQKLTLSDGKSFFFQIPVSKDALKRLKEWISGTRWESPE